MTSKSQRNVLAAVIIAMMPAANAAERLDVDRVVSCANEQDDAKRLACYDDAVAAAKKPSREQPAPVAVTKPVTEQPAAPSPGSVPPAPSAATAPAAGEFGVAGSAIARQRHQEQEQERDDSGKVERITAEVTAVSAKPRGELIITLDNGQVWAQKRKERYFAARPGDKVTIDAGMLGSYRMIIDNRSTHVTRIK